jgi:LPS-assembly protein
MLRPLQLGFLVIVAALAAASTAAAQFSVSSAGYDVTAGRQERLGEQHWLLSESVELERGDTTLFADEVEFFEAENRAIASGNVVFTQGTNRISADRADFNTRTGLGTFYHATGISAAQAPRQRTPIGGIVVPQATGQDTDVIFFGETIEKLAPKKYRITNGGFSTCVQPTPRWEMSAGTITLNVDDYTVLRQAIFKVKGVPMFYLPIMYYPTQEDGRATGFLIPTYGSSTLKGQTLRVPFFWAIDRSQDATIEYEWYSKLGRGASAEYRYNRGSGAGAMNAYVLDQQEVVYPTGSLPAERSFSITGNAVQQLPGRLRASARADYFSSISTNQIFNSNPYSPMRNSRTFGGNIVGSWRSYSLNVTVDRNEYFNTPTSSGVRGTSPRITFSRSERPLFGNAPLYFSVSTDATHFDRQTRDAGVVIDDRGLSRFDVSPTIRYPFTKWQWFTVNSSVNWRDTFYTRSLDDTGLVVEQNLNRHYFTMSANAVGPVLTRVWDTPNSGYAERLKHTIEPVFNVERTTAVPQHDNIVQIDSIDSPYGNTTSLTYGVYNRLYAKRQVGRSSVAQEIASLSITQRYYTDARASRVDPNYPSSYTTGDDNHFNPVLVNLRVTPSPSFNTTMRAEIDSRYKELRYLTVSAGHDWSRRIQTQAGWSHRFFIKDLSGYNDKAFLDHLLNLSTHAQTLDNKYGLDYALNYDLLRSTLTQQRISGFYNSQCCGIALSYQQVHTPSGYPLPSDRRFYLSFSLAGIGSFSPLSSMGGGAR